MTKILAILVFFILVKPVFADSYSDYQYQFGKYRENYQVFSSAKATYQTYKTLTTKNDALEKMRKTLVVRDEVVKSFLNFVGEKVAPVNSGFLATFSTQKIWLTNHQQLVLAAASLEDINNLSVDFDQKYAEIISSAKQAIGEIIMAQTDLIALKTDDFISRVSLQLDRVQQVGEDNTLGERNLEVARAKANLYDGKRASIKALLYPKDSYEKTVNLSSAQTILIEGLAYLKEATNYLLEIIKNVTE